MLEYLKVKICKNCLKIKSAQNKNEKNHYCSFQSFKLKTYFSTLDKSPILPKNQKFLEKVFQEITCCHNPFAKRRRLYLTGTKLVLLLVKLHENNLCNG